MTWHKHHSWEWPLVQKLALPKKDMTLWTVTCGVCNKERASCQMSANLSGGKDLTCEQYPNITPRNKKSERGKGQTWKNLYVNQDGPTRSTKQMCHLTCPFRANEDQDVIQIDNNMQTLVMAKEQNRFGEGCKITRGCGKPKG